jgi:hypothetical protein
MSDRNRTVTIYRDDTTTQWELKRVKAFFWTAGNTVLTVAQWAADTGDEHGYVHIPREIICWFKDSGSTSANETGENR